ncbi:MAG: PA2779 family protein [Gammaproteobacteria bacterium]|nr:PA2779 family protein [Gammaproteobacteria bacterium]
MLIFRTYRRLIAALTTMAFLLMHIMPVQAAMVGNAELLADAQHQYNKLEILSMLDRTEVQEQLVAMGVDLDKAKSRVDQMTDIEIAQLNQQLENMPVGSGALGLIVFLFVLFVITDMLGATDVFPFVNKL